MRHRRLKNIYWPGIKPFQKRIVTHNEMKRNEEILQELKKIAPVLASAERKNFYRVPEGYFEQAKLNLLDLIDTQIVKEEMTAVAPHLSSLEKKNTFEVPASYFTSFPQKMMSRIEADQKLIEVSATPGWLIQMNAIVEDVFSVFFKPKYAVAFAGFASTALIAAMFFTHIEQQCSDLDCKMAKLSDQELNTYLDSHTDEITDEVFEDTGFDRLSDETNTDGLKDAMTNLTDEELNNAILD